jgi:hypothetical protein
MIYTPGQDTRFIHRQVQPSQQAQPLHAVDNECRSHSIKKPANKEDDGM